MLPVEKMDLNSLTAEKVLRNHGGHNSSEMVVRAVALVKRFVEIGEANERLSSQLLESQQAVIGLQEQLLDAKDEQLNAVTAAVEEKMEEVTQEVKDYSAAVRSGTVSGGASLSQAEVKSAVRTVLADRADEQGRECNMVVFGVEEEAGEKVDERVAEVLTELDVKPKFTAQRRSRVTRR